MGKGRKIAAGWEAEIYEWFDGISPKILKLYYGYDGTQARIERDITWKIYNAGVPVPEVFGDVVTIDGRPGYIMERISGADMDKQLVIRAFDKNFTNKLARQLGELHARIHRVEGINLQQNYKDRLAFSIKRAQGISDSEKSITLRLLDTLPDGNRICHRDFHAGNVIIRNGNPVVIDWGNAGVGDPMADVARTQLILTMGWIGASLIDKLLSRFVRRLKANLNQNYMEAYFSESDSDPSDVDKWRIVIAAGRLGDGLPRSQQKHVAKFVHEKLAS